MVQHFDLNLPPLPRGIHLVTKQLIAQLPPLPQNGMLHLLLQHTSAGLLLNENADPTVRTDMEAYLDRIAPEHAPYFLHTYEGPDDMPAHLKSALTGVQLTLPIRNGRLTLGTWQGIYLAEFRNHGGSRKILASIQQ